MPNRPVVKIRLVFRDRSANEASTHLYLPFATPVDDVFDFVNAALPRYDAVSNAIVAKVIAEYEFYYTGLPAPSEVSNLQRSLLVFYRNELEEIEALSILSPKAEIFEQSGEYAGIRLDLTHPAVIQWQAVTMGGGVQFLTKDGDIIGPEIVTGGLAI